MRLKERRALNARWLARMGPAADEGQSQEILNLTLAINHVARRASTGASP